MNYLNEIQHLFRGKTISKKKNTCKLLVQLRTRFLYIICHTYMNFDYMNYMNFDCPKLIDKELFLVSFIHKQEINQFFYRGLNNHIPGNQKYLFRFEIVYRL